MIKQAFAAALLLTLGACSGTSNVGRLVNSSPSPETQAPAPRPTLSATLPSPYNTYTPPLNGGVCGFEKVVNPGANDVGIAGWAIIDAKTGALPEQIILAVDSAGTTQYSTANRTRRADVADFFKNPKLAESGFEVVLPIPKTKRPILVTAILAYDGKLFQCDEKLKVGP